MPNQNEVTFPVQNDVLVPLFAVLDALGAIARRMHPSGLGALVATLTDRDQALRSAVQAMDVAADADPAAWAAHQASREQIRLASSFALQACDALRGAVDSANSMREAYRALRRYSRALEALTGLAETVPAVGRYLLEPGFRDDPERLAWLAAPSNPNTGVFHFGNRTDERGGFSVYVPPWYEPARPASGGHGAAWRRRARPVVPVELGPGSADTSADRHRADRNRRHVGADGTGNRQS